MLDGKEINDTAKRFLLNWKANKDARRRQKKQFQLEPPSSNSLSTIPTLPALKGSSHSTLPSSGYLSDTANPMVRLAGSMESNTIAGYFGQNHKTMTALVQARAPHSTLLRQRVHYPQSR